MHEILGIIIVETCIANEKNFIESFNYSYSLLEKNSVLFKEQFFENFPNIKIPDIKIKNQ